MRLAKLTLCGFKSFADHAEFTFDTPVTGIVGPNGCGKSNVVDAIMWVLGERSSKSLRGTEMLDVIFAGSAARKPSGMASVTLTFENPVLADPPRRDAPPDALVQTLVETAVDPAADPSAADHADNATETAEPAIADVTLRGRRGLPIDADVVEVERRLYRDGTSEYLINGRRARLRDIRELFLDTGIGADAYSIIEQGKVDAMLLASPQERRVIFEEAAGVAKYKQRRIEAQRKLERAVANLSTAREQLDSTERRLRLVKGQAAKARKFKELDEQLKACRCVLALHLYDETATRLLDLTRRQMALTDERGRAHDAVSHSEHARQEAELARQELTTSLRRLEQQAAAAAHTQEQARQRLDLTQRALSELLTRMDADHKAAQELEQQTADVRAASAAQADVIAELTSSLRQAEALQAQAADERAAAMEALAERRAEVNEARSAVGRIERERAALLAACEADQARATQAREQLDSLASRSAALTAERERVLSEAAALSASVASVRARLAESEAALAAAERDMDQLAAGRRDEARAVQDAEQALARLESRRSTLHELSESRAGYAESVRRALARRDAGDGFAGVLAPLADLIEIDDSADAATGVGAWAVEAALGPVLQSLVVRTAADLPTPEELASLPGRATFLTLAPLASRASAAEADELIAASGGRVTSLRSAVRARAGSPEGAGELLNRLLADTYLVTDLDAALVLSAGPMAGARFVMPGGVVLEPDGRVVAGPMKAGDEGVGVMERRAELARLDAQIASASADLADRRTRLRETDEQAAALSVRAGELRTAVSALQRQAVGEQAKLERCEGDAARTAREISDLAHESRMLAERAERLDAERARQAERAESLRRLGEEQAERLRRAEAEAARLSLRADAAGEQVSAARVEVGTLSEQMASARRESARLEREAEDLRRRAGDLERHRAQSSSRAEEHRASIAGAAGEIERARAEAEELRGRVDDVADQLRRADAVVADLSAGLQARREHAASVDREWNDAEVERRNAEDRREALEDRTRQDLSLDLAAEHAEYRALMESGVPRVDAAALQAEIDGLRDAVKRLGNVNLDAIDEESQLEARNEELIRQVRDIDEAKATLEGLIKRLNEASRERFAAVFERIQENFGGEAGMFRKMFGGGKAEVRLMPLIREVETATGVERVQTDEVDLLESGIEVIAKPPGKEPRSISQLSGGEKTLTAVALLMAIFRSKPSCFCVLDEVDAALDEANVQRFAGVIRQFTDQSHFIVITHNKRTMQQADQLFGVTMQERGVSKRVSVNFEQVGKDGTIREAAGRDVEPAVVQTRGVSSASAVTS